MKTHQLFTSLEKGNIFRFLGTNKYYEVLAVRKTRVVYKAQGTEDFTRTFLSFKEAGQSKVMLK